MAGHSKWANIKHRKQGVDKRKGILFSKLAKELMIATRLSGTNMQTNTRLRIAIAQARNANMPNNTIERSIKKGAGELEGVVYEEIIYEVFAHGGLGIILECLTDKKSRTTPEIKSLLNKHGANLAETNSVTRLFKKQGLALVPSELISEEKLFELVVDHGVEDLQKDDDSFIIISSEKEYLSVIEVLNKEKIDFSDNSGIKFLALESTQVKLDKSNLSKALKLIESLEEHDDVQAVHSNLNMSDQN